MATTRAPRKRGIPEATPADKQARMRELLTQGRSLGAIATEAGVGRDTVRRYRDRWVKDGSLVLPAAGTPTRAAANVESGSQEAGEVGSEPTAAADGDELAADGGAGGDDGELDLPPERDEEFGLGIDPSVIALTLQYPHSLVTTWELLVARGLELNFNEWVVQTLDDCLSRHLRIRIALVRVDEQGNVEVPGEPTAA